MNVGRLRHTCNFCRRKFNKKSTLDNHARVCQSRLESESHEETYPDLLTDTEERVDGHIVFTISEIVDENIENVPINQ